MTEACVQPTLATDRLELRAFSAADAPDVARLCGDREIAAGTLTIPHPYPRSAATEWISRQPERFASGAGANFAAVERETGALVGSVGLVFEEEHKRAELGYWIGMPHWGRGYATEAVRAVIRYGFEERGLNRIYAYHFSNNPASGRVMQKVGMTYEGVRRQHTLKWGEFLDNEGYGILRHEWSAA